MATASVPEPARTVAEGWILAGTVDGTPCYPALDTTIAGLPHLWRLVGELVMCGVHRVFVLGDPQVARVLIAGLEADPRFAKARVTVAAEPPAGAAHDGIVVVRADRVFHRDIPKAAVAAWRDSTATLGRVDGDDAVYVCDRGTAGELAAAAAEPGALASAAGSVADTVAAPAPYLGFTAAVRTPAQLRAAQRRLVWSLRKSADGIASKLINRHVSLPITWLVMRTRVVPNQVTLTALVCAMAGAIVIGQGGYLAGAIGMLLVELGSIVDGIDGELARLKFLFSRTGQWLDTVVDDIANVCYSTGIMLNLTAAGVTWAKPLWLAATIGFVLTQTSQYWLIKRVYHSGDLAAIPWAFQSTAFLSQRPRGVWPWIKATAPKLLKRDSAVTIFTIFALAGHLDWILVGYCTGALVFFFVFFVQFVRNAGAVRRALRGDQ